MKKYGYKSFRAFKDAHPSKETFYAIAADDRWDIAKRVLFHPECPIELREQFRQDKTWYKRFVAIFAGAAPKGYMVHALKDPDRRVQLGYLRPLYNHTVEFLTKLEVLK